MKRNPENRRWVAGLRAAVLACAAAVLCWPLTIGPGIAAAIGGTLIGCWLAERWRLSPLRLSSALGLAFFALIVGTWIARLPVTMAPLARSLGPIVALRWSEVALWLAILTPLAFALRFTAARRPNLAMLEVLTVATAVASGFAAHRQGMVHRPLAIGDWAWSRGFDPAVVFLILGGLGTLLLAALMIQEGRKRRLPLHFSALVLVALALLLVVRFEGLPAPDPAGGLGLTGEPEDESGGQGQGGDGGQNDERDSQLDDLEFKDEYGSSGEPQPVAVVLLHDDYSPPSGVYYFRQSVFSQYNGRRLVQATRDDVDIDIVRHFPFAELRIPEAPATSKRRKALRTTTGLMVDHVRPFALDSPVIVEPADNPDPIRFQRAFGVRSHVRIEPYDELLGQRAGDADWTDEQWRHYTEAPADPRYGALANQLMEGLQEDYRGDPLAQALAIKIYLDKNGIYSRKSRHADQQDPAGSFLFGDLTGYCVHFAHAATYLFRSRGIPARVAAGYAVAESDRGAGSTILIRGGNAHAWPEIYLEKIGWVVVDLAPETTLDEATQAPDQALQQMLGEMMRQGQNQDEANPSLSQAFDWQEFGRRLLWFAAALLVLGYGIKIYRRLAPWITKVDGLPRVGYRAALDRLAEIGLRRRLGESRENFARRAQTLTPSFAELTAHHLGWALGSSRDAAPQEWRSLLGRVGSELQGNIPWWRRALGYLDPTSWLRAR